MRNPQYGVPSIPRQNSKRMISWTGHIPNEWQRNQYLSAVAREISGKFKINDKNYNLWGTSDAETLSDHRYLLTDLYLPELGSRGRNRYRVPQMQRQEEEGTHPRLKKWAVRKINEENLMTTIQAAVWTMETWLHSATNVGKKATQLQRKLREICDFAMPRFRSYKKKNVVECRNRGSAKNMLES